MSKDIFKFKQFNLNQENAKFKFGTDSMILGSWVQGKNIQNILDIGTGTGALALMMAQKFEDAIVDAVELDPAAAQLSRENFSNSKFDFRLNLYEQKFQNFAEEEIFHYDLIISNPPYFEPSNRNKGIGAEFGTQKEMAKSTLNLSFKELIKGVNKLLHHRGIFAFILPLREANELEKMLITEGFYPARKLKIKSKAETEVLRLACEFVKGEEMDTQIEELIIYDEKGQYTNPYRLLTADFHSF